MAGASLWRPLRGRFDPKTGTIARSKNIARKRALIARCFVVSYCMNPTKLKRVLISFF
jgi:hypothetical protein